MFICLYTSVYETERWKTCENNLLYDGSPNVETLRNNYFAHGTFKLFKPKFLTLCEILRCCSETCHIMSIARSRIALITTMVPDFILLEGKKNFCFDLKCRQKFAQELTCSRSITSLY